MGSYNKVIIMGNITRDLELRYTPGGTAVTDMGMAINDKRKDQNGEFIEETTFVDVTLWGRNAEVAAEYLGKGSPVLIDGRLKLDQWETDDGDKRQKLKVVCDRMQMLGSKGDSGGEGGGSKQSANSKPESSGDGNSSGDDVPF